jgi:hypothetical protein
MNFKGMPITKENLRRFGWKETESDQGVCWMYDPANDEYTTGYSTGGVRVYFHSDGTGVRVGVEDESDYVHISDSHSPRCDMRLLAQALALHDGVDEMAEVVVVETEREPTCPDSDRQRTVTITNIEDVPAPYRALVYRLTGLNAKKEDTQ